MVHRVKYVIRIFNIFLLFFFASYLIYYFLERNNETYYDYKSRSEFYQMMRKKNKFDFIKTAERELENIDTYINNYKTDEYLLFRFYLIEEKIRLIEEIEETKLRIYSETGKIKDRPKDYKTFEKDFPEFVLKFKDYGKILEYKKIDYLNIFETEEEKEKSKLKSNKLKSYEKGKEGLICEYKILDLFGIENFGLTFSKIDYYGLNPIFLNEYIRMDDTIKQLDIKNGINDLFYEQKKVGNIITKIDGEEMICSVKFHNLNFEELDNCRFKKKSDNKSYPYYLSLTNELRFNKSFTYYIYSTDEWIYLIYPGVSESEGFFKSLRGNDLTSPYFITLDSKHKDQKKYILVKCKKNFFENVEDYFSDTVIKDIINNHIINYLMVFYQEEDF